MAWEWVAPTVTGLTAVAAIAATTWISDRARAQTERLATKAREGELADRLYEDRREAYLSLLQHMQRLTNRFALLMRRDMAGFEREKARAREPEFVANQEAMYARIAAFGSPEILSMVQGLDPVLAKGQEDPHGVQEETRRIRRQIREELSAMNGLPEAESGT